MAMLLAMFQKMRLVRERNQMQLDLTRYSSKLSRVEKNIKNIQKMYQSRLTNLESQATRMKNSASIFFRNMSGLGMNQINTNMGAYWNGGGQLTQFMMNQMQGMIGQEIPYKDSNNKDAKGTIDKDRYQALLQSYMQYGSQGMMYKYQNGQPVKKTNAEGKEEYELAFEQWEVNAFLGSVQNASMLQNMAQSNLATTSQNYENNISIWLEAAKEEIEAEQDAALEPLNYEQTMDELEKTYLETALKRKEQEIQSYDELLSNETKNSAPKFGLS